MISIPSLSSRGAQIPVIGFGTSQLGNCGEIVATALRLRHSHIASTWRPTPGKRGREGVQASGVPRKDIFLVTKVSHESLRADDFAKSVDESLERLQTDYVDLLF